MGIIGFVCDHTFACVISDQCLSLGDIALLPSCQYEPQRVSEAVHAHMDFRSEPASAPTEGL